MRGLPVLALLCGCWGDTTQARPACDEPEVIASVRGIADTHPGFQPRLPGRTTGVVDVRQTRERDAPDVGAGAFERLCYGTVQFEGGVAMETGWQILSERTIFGPIWSVTPCFGTLDPAGADCTTYAEGRLPGEPRP